MFKLHIVTIYLSYLSFFVASLAAILYLIQNSALKHKKIGLVFRRLPDLAFLDKLNYRSIGLGFPVLTFSILIGFARSNSLYGNFWAPNIYNYRHLLSLVIWLVYAAILHMRLSERMRGKKVAVLSILAFFIIIVSLFGNCP